MHSFFAKSGSSVLVAVLFFLLSSSVVHATPDPYLTGGSSITSYTNIAAAITDLQLSGTGNPTVPVKLRVTSGTLAMSTTTGLTFTGSSTGSTLQFSGTLSNVNTALATLTYTRSGTGSDTLEASLVNAGEVFFEGTGHLYEYVSFTATWNNAKTNAESRTKYGATGYLTTITSADENSFVAARLLNAGWMGASDSAVEGDWKWVTGPENGTSFWSGLSNGSAVSGRYENWGNSEPNDYQNGVPGEDCAQFLSGGTGEWNDLPCTGTTLPGYVVEYGSSGSPIDISSLNVSITTLAADVTAPTVTSISSNKTNGSYTVGEVIDIDVTFSEAVTSTGNVTVTLETGSTDRTCSFSVSSSTVGTCNYTVQAGDVSSDLTVSSLAGTIRDASNNAMTNFTPGTNLASNKALVIDTTDPTANTISPTDGATGISVTSNIVLTFDAAVNRQTGSILIKKSSDDSTVETIDVTSGQVTGTGTNTITINPSVTFASETSYYIQIAATAFDDLAGNSYAGITDTTSWNFTTADVQEPTILNFSPVDDATNVSLTTNLTLTFTEAVDVEVGNVVMKRSIDDSVVETIDVTSGQVTGSGTTSITINPSVVLEYSVGYYIQIAATAFDDLAGNSYAGITDTTSWNFTTMAEPEEGEELEVYAVEYVVTETTLTVHWKTNNDADATLEYGTTRSLNKKKSEKNNEKKHSITLEGLDADTLYYFRVTSEDEEGSEDESRMYSVTTNKKEVAPSVSTRSLEPTPELPKYQDLKVEVDAVPQKEEPKVLEDTPTFDPIESPKIIREKIEKQYATEVFKKDDQQYIKEVKFQILDDQQNPIPNLPVTLHSEPRTGVTNEEGVVTFSDVPTGEHRLLFAYDGKSLEKAIAINDLKQSSGPVKAEVIVVTMAQDPLPLWVWGVLGMCIVVILILLFFLYRRRDASN